MEGGDADSAADDGGQGGGIAARDPDKRDSDAADEHADGHEPGAVHPVRRMAEERLDDRGADGEREEERRRGGVGEAAVANQVGQERGDGALAEIAREVAGGDRRERAPVGPDGGRERVDVRGHARHGTERGAVNRTSIHQPPAPRPHPKHASMPAMKFESFSRFSSSSAAAVSAAVAAPAAHTAGNVTATRPTAASSPHTR